MGDYVPTAENLITGRDSWQQAVAGIRRVQERLGPDRVSALMTTTEASLGRAAEIIDTYAEFGLRGLFLRPVSPYGFALRGRGGANYDVGRWLEFYAAGLDRIVELNRQGVPMVEIYASIIAKNRPFYSGKHTKHGMNLQVIASPAGDIVGSPGRCPARCTTRRAEWIRGVLAELEAAGLVTLAGKGYQGSSYAKIPYRGKNKPGSQKQASKAHAKLRAPGERANAQLKAWGILRTGADRVPDLRSWGSAATSWRRSS